MTDGDEALFVAFVKTTGDVVFLPWISNSATFQPIVTFPLPKSGKDWYKLGIVNRSIPGTFKADPSPKEAGAFIWSPYESTVIDFDRSFTGREKRVRWGRLWADGPRFFSEPQFGKWYERLERWIKTHYHRIDDGMTFAGPEALVIYQAAGRPANRVPLGEKFLGGVGWM
jgi:hypothetical protein